MIARSCCDETLPKPIGQTIDWNEITYPVSTKNISKFEVRNEIGVNLLAVEGRTIYICRKAGNYEQKVNLMLLEEGERKHYVAVKSLSR